MRSQLLTIEKQFRMNVSRNLGYTQQLIAWIRILYFMNTLTTLTDAVTGTAFRIHEFELRK